MSQTLHIVHLSDLHFRLNWEEEQGVVLKSFFADLKQQVRLLDNENVFLVFSGDIAQAGADVSLYSAFYKQFNNELNSIGITRDKRICIPGNHDASADYIKANQVLHEGLISQDLKETQFNNFCTSNETFLADKFSNYLECSEKFAKYGLSSATIGGAGFKLTGNIGIYCLNTALCSSAGLRSDFQNLAIDTRSLYRWTHDSEQAVRILVMHHPREWLCQWANDEMVKIMGKSFSLCLSGHTHGQLIYHTLNTHHSITTCSAPPIFTNKHDDIGYAIISVSNYGVEKIRYRQWTKHHTFVSGTSFSNSDDGVVHVGNLAKGASLETIVDPVDIESQLVDQLSKALASFQGQSNIWVEPIISTRPIADNNANDKEYRVDLATILHGHDSIEFLAPPQFGLTSLGKGLALEAWKRGLGFWLCIDCINSKSNSILKDIESSVAQFGLKSGDIAAFILDSWSPAEKDHGRILTQIQKSFKEVRIILMHTLEESAYLTPLIANESTQKFSRFFLHSLTKNRVRQLVVRHIQIHGGGDEDFVLNRVINEIEALNIHRTPENCLTILKVAEIEWEESPINRTEVIRRVLYLLFNTDAIPGYKERPDLKDCEYVLGQFCENILRNNRRSFKREYFIDKLKEYCTERVLTLDVEVVFDVLFANNILVIRSEGYEFKAVYWIYYFAAHRMYHDTEFCKHILDKQNYLRYPEIVEFYTGIDRSRTDALLIILNDLRDTCDTVNKKCGLPLGMNPYRFAQWNPSEEAIKKMHDEVSTGLLGSNFPDIVKDEYSDNGYNPVRPFDHEIGVILNDFSVDRLKQALKAGSRALRNSDYAKPDVKRELLKEVMRSWEQVSMVVVAISTLLARQGQASFDGHGFELRGDFGEDYKERLTRIWSVIPMNIVNWFKNDLSSKKLGALFKDSIDVETNELRKHCLIRMLIVERPLKWKVMVEDYIAETGKNSFYLWDCVNAVRSEYEFGYLKPKELNDARHLIKMGLAKHTLGTKRPGITAISKVPDDVLPKRQTE